MSTDFLFMKQSLINGMASIANLSGTIPVNASNTPEEADTRAIASDWDMVGSDISEALNRYDRR